MDKLIHGDVGIPQLVSCADRCHFRKGATTRVVKIQIPTDKSMAEKARKNYPTIIQEGISMTTKMANSLDFYNRFQ